MKTTPEALKALYQTLGGSSGNVAGESKTTGILNKIAALFGSTVTADKIPDAIDNINAVASGVTKPDGKITITENATDINVAQYATADVNVSGGGSSEFSTAEVTVVNNIVGFSPSVMFSGAQLPGNENFMGSCYFDSEHGLYPEVPNVPTSSFTIVRYADCYGCVIVTGSYADDWHYVITGSGEVVNIGSEQEPYYGVKITGDCTITLEAGLS